MINYNPFLSQEENMSWVNLYKNSKLGSKIKILPRVSKHIELARLISLADCGVFPARAEGWNNEIPEFFALNKPVITTNYSAHTEYCNTENSFLVDIERLEPAIDDKFFDGYGNWANIGKKQQDQFVEYMRYVYTNKVQTNSGGLNKAKELVWDNTANIIYNNIG
jgi:glycosyltransferase involved in cell wall biosynthesis